MEKEITFIDKLLDEVTLVFKKQWKVFLLSLIAQFVVAVLLNLGMQTPEAFRFMSLLEIKQNVSKLVSPQSVNADIFDLIRPKLEQKPNSFQLKKENTLITSVYAAADYDKAKSYVVVDLASGKVLAAKDSDHQVSIASLTKVMSAVVSCDLALQDELFNISQHAANMEPTKIGVVAGQQMKLSELLDASLLTSANDATQVMAEGINRKYGEDVFVRAMNEKALVLGLKNTHFTNPQGLDMGNPYSSAEDYAVLAAYALQNYPQIDAIVGKDYQFLVADNNHKQFDLYNWNGLIGVYPGAYGVKIGNTDEAGYTSTVAAQRDGNKVLVVLLGAPGVLERDMWAGELLDMGFSKFGLKPVNISEATLEAKYSSWKYWQ